jgi:hypothetical protein
MAGGLVALAGMTLVIFEVAVALLARERLLRRRGAAVRRGGEALFFARRLHAMANRWSASGSSHPGHLACRFALGRLLDARRGLARVGDECIIIRIEREIGQNAALRGVAARGIYWTHESPDVNRASPLRALQGARIRQCLDEAAVLSAEASAQFSHRMFQPSRESYRRARTLLSALHKTARLSGWPEMVLEIRTAWDDCRRHIEACDEHMVGSDFCPDPMVRLYVKGRIDPCFRRDDGSAPARPDRPGFWGLTWHALNH